MKPVVLEMILAIISHLSVLASLKPHHPSLQLSLVPCGVITVKKLVKCDKCSIIYNNESLNPL